MLYFQRSYWQAVPVQVKYPKLSPSQTLAVQELEMVASQTIRPTETVIIPTPTQEPFHLPLLGDSSLAFLSVTIPPLIERGFGVKVGVDDHSASGLGLNSVLQYLFTGESDRSELIGLSEAISEAEMVSAVKHEAQMLEVVMCIRMRFLMRFINIHSAILVRSADIIRLCTNRRGVSLPGWKAEIVKSSIIIAKKTMGSISHSVSQYFSPIPFMRPKRHRKFYKENLWQ
jgi:hypothetical protein